MLPTLSIISAGWSGRAVSHAPLKEVRAALATLDFSGILLRAIG